MANVNTDSVTLLMTDEDAGPPFGQLSGTPIWFMIQPKAISKFGAEIKTTPRAPISKNLQRLKGKTTDLDSGVSYGQDITFEMMWRHLPRVLFAKYANEPDKGPQNGFPLYPTAVTATEFVVPANGDLPEDTIVFACGFAKDENNGMFLVGAGSTGTTVPVTGTVIEACDQPAQNAQLWVIGVQAATSDVDIDVTDGVVTLESTVLDFTKLGVNEGQFVRVGGVDDDTFFVATASNGDARIAAGGLSANAMVLDKWSTTPVSDAGTGKTIQIFFGPFIHNVAVDDDLYEMIPTRIQATWEDLGGVGTPMYSQSKGNFPDQAAFAMPISSIGELNITMVGTDTDPPDESAATGSDDFRNPVLTDSFNTSSEIVRLRCTEEDETGITTDFLTATLNIKNNVSPKKVLATLGAKYMNRGLIEVSLDADVIFTNDAVLAAVRGNTTVTGEGGFWNADGQGFYYDIPEMTIGDGAPSFPEHDQVQLKCTFNAHRSVKFGYTVSFSLFPFLPS